ncbi:hypothetical protein Tco_1038846 [Tanacetum coccineum]
MAFTLKHIWNLAVKKESIWTEWINTVRLKGGSIWDVVNDRKASWGWNNLLAMRDKIRPHVKYKVGNGKKIMAWYDTWIGDDSLSKFISHRDIYKCRFDNNARLADICGIENWSWPDEWVVKAPILNMAPTNVRLNKDIDDRAVWIDKKKREVYFLLEGFGRILDRIERRVAVWQPGKIMNCALYGKVRLKLFGLRMKNSKAVKEVADMWKIIWKGWAFLFAEYVVYLSEELRWLCILQMIVELVRSSLIGNRLLRSYGLDVC